MPTYLSPGVYVEEVERGPIPIQGVSTSTGGMVGLAERGPVDAPTLLTGPGQFQRIFGDPLSPADPSFSTLPAGFNALAYAVEGFFANGGKRVYVTRVLPEGTGGNTTATPGQQVVNLNPALSSGAQPYTLTFTAVDPGAWPNLGMGMHNGKYQQVGGLRLSFGEAASNATTLQANAAALATTMTLNSVVGIQVGVTLRAPDAAQPDKHQYFIVTNLAGNVVTVSPALSAAVNANADPVELVGFWVTVDLLRNGEIVGTETFANLSTNPLLPNYAEHVIGKHLTGIGLRRSPGSSNYVRVEVSAQAVLDANTILIRGPLATSPTQPPITFPASGGGAGNDECTAANLGHTDIFIGTSSDDPALRTGLQSLTNVRDISIVAIPGQAATELQDALLSYCENERYRFAILDMQPTPNTNAATDWHFSDATPDQVMIQRGSFDSKYGALYYPWLVIPDPFPANPLNVTNVAIPPSGHVMGIYARSDTERGVHKAPANEVVNNIIDFSHHVDTGTQDVLNPIGVNVLRDFRVENRGLRVWGARTLTSDMSWKYINVRRLFIFLEASIERGTQWVVFEPNNEMLWVRVKQSVSEFLTDVWRTGALMGTKPQEAFYVTCDRTTMTQSDIENGRLIVEIGVAPTFPAEFVIFRIGQWAGGSSLSEG